MFCFCFNSYTKKIIYTHNCKPEVYFCQKKQYIQLTKSKNIIFLYKDSNKTHVSFLTSTFVNLRGTCKIMAKTEATPINNG